MGGQVSLNNKKPVSNTQGTAVTTKKNLKKVETNATSLPLLPLPKPQKSQNRTRS